MKILHLEDDHTKAETIASRMPDDDITLVMYWKAFQAAIHEDQSWDLVISDLNVPIFPGHFPGNMGKPTVGEARRAGYRGPIIFISGCPEQGDYLAPGCWMIGYQRVERWQEVINEVRADPARLSTCGQCGNIYSWPSCGPTHALRAQELRDAVV